MRETLPMQPEEREHRIHFTPLKLLLFGHGKMGTLVADMARDRGHEIVVISTRANEREVIEGSSIAQADLCIDFSHPSAVLKHIEAAALAGKSIVVGTTGWYDHLERARLIVERQGIGCLYAPNFSLGVLLFMQIVQYASKLMNRFPSYDVGGLEIHHNQKIDTPSGTAQALSEIITKNISRKSSIVHDLSERPIASCEFHMTSLRVGHQPGTHTILFDSTHDTLLLTHEARHRNAFAEGALIASEWLHGKKGWFGLEDLLPTTI